MVTDPLPALTAVGRYEHAKADFEPVGDAAREFARFVKGMVVGVETVLERFDGPPSHWKGSLRESAAESAAQGTWREQT